MRWRKAGHGRQAAGVRPGRRGPDGGLAGLPGRGSRRFCRAFPAFYRPCPFIKPPRHE
ncbi:hypothetical protein [Lysobacter gummosus]|uniref:hypothetical protein n=1 Tax=Lysobacter gummosus TaxID=262324 RepID=UPI00362942F8